MGGCQQIDKLIRKNLLLKVRRPKATCFELVLPLVLFALLALMRKEYEGSIRHFPATRFGNEPIFPQTRRLVELVEDTASGTLAWGADASAFADSLWQGLACDLSRYTTWAEDMLEPVLAFSLGLANRSLADEFLRFDAVDASGMALRLVHSMQEADVDELVSLVEDGRSAYFSSQWSRQLEATARHADGELSLLRAELRSTDDSLEDFRSRMNGTDVRSRVQGWLNDACHLQGPFFEDWNTSELARDLAHLRRALDESGLMDLLKDARDALDSAALPSWVDELTDEVNNSLAMTWLDEALDELGSSELKTWLVDIRNAMDMQEPMSWFNKTLDAIDSSEVKTWLIELKDFMDSSQPMTWVNMTLNQMGTSEVKAWLLRIHDLMNTTQHLRWLNRTIDEVDSPALRNDLKNWLDRIVRAMDITRPNSVLDRAPSMSIPANFQRLKNRLERLGNRTRTLDIAVRMNWSERSSSTWSAMAPGGSVSSWATQVQDMIWWTSHFARPESHLSPALQLGHDVAGVVTVVDVNASLDSRMGTDASLDSRMGSEASLDARLQMQLPRLNRTMQRIRAALSSAGSELRGEANRTFPELEKKLDEASAVASRLASLLGEANSSKSLRMMVYEAFEQVSSNLTLQTAFGDVLHQMNLDGSINEEIDKALQEADFGGSIGREVVDALRRVNFSNALEEEVHIALRRANLTSALRAEMKSVLQRVNLSESLSDEVVDALCDVNLSRSLRSELASALARSNLSQCLDVQVTKALHEARSCIGKLDEYVAAWRQHFDELFVESNLTSDGPLTAFLDAIANLTGLNATEIEGQVLPAWKEEWHKQCRKINVSKVGDLFVRTQQSCPFYRSKLEASENLNLTQQVLDGHAELRRADTEKFRSGLEAIQRELRRLNASRMERAVERVILSAQNLDQWRTGELDWSEWSNSQKVAHSLVRTLRDEFLGNLSNVSCADAAESVSEEMLGWIRDEVEGETGEGTRRLGGRKSQLTDLILERKLLIAPYKGDVRELWDLVLVELVLSFTSSEHGGAPGGFTGALLRCPVLRGAVAVGVDSFMRDRVETFDTERELERFAMANPDDVLAAIVFRGADEATGNFPRGGLDVRYALRYHATFLPSTARVIRNARYNMFGGIREDLSPYMLTGFAYVQEAIGRATARLRAKRESQAGAGAGGAGAEVRHNVWAQNATAVIRRLSVAGEMFPTPSFKIDAFIYAIQHMLPMFMIMGWIYCVSLLVKEMVYEKQERLREVMRIQGLRTWVYWLSWTTFAMAQLSLLVVAMVSLLCFGNVLQHSDPSAIFFFFLVYSGAVVSLAMLISSCFSRAKVAAVCAGLFYYSFYLPFAIYNRFEEKASLAGKCAFCLMCPTGLGVGMSLVAKWELLEEGLQWKNFALAPPVTNTGALPNSDFSLAHVVLMFFVDMFVYQVLAWYIEKVFPGDFGLPQPFYFPFLPSYWRNSAEASNAPQRTEEEVDNPKLECYEAAAPELIAAVQIRRLAKTFRGGKQALRGVSLDMHQGTILGLLGHNGAGKSTTMSILTGLYPPSAGDVLVNGCSVRRDSGSVRKQLGVCLQQNALYDALTVQEHLDLFCNLKSVPRAKVSAEVDVLLRDTGLEPKRHAPTRSLSGGMKRKLSIGIALAGGSKVIALDEPTAGVDATSRRDIWQLLSAHKKSRAILLSTHFMDEADVLSDRIAIIAEGQLTAIGSSVGLKKRFADRYLLTIVTSDHADSSHLLSAVRSVVPGASWVGARGREFSYALPSSARARFAGLFHSLQDDQARQRLGVETYGLSAATMEEVFLMASSVHEEGLHGVVRNVQEDAASDDQSTASGGGSSRPHSASVDASRPGTPPTARSNEKDMFPEGNATFDNSGHSEGSNSREVTTELIEPPPFSPQCISVMDLRAPAKEVLPDVDNSLKHAAEEFHSVGSQGTRGGKLLRGPRLLWQQFCARLWARAQSARRDRNAWASQILLPVCFVLFALVIAWILDSRKEEPPLKIDTDMFIGSASGSKNTLDYHTIPFSDARGDAFSANVYASFAAAKGAKDVLRQVPSGNRTGGDGTEELAQYIMDNKNELRGKAYSAVSVAGHGETANLTLFYDNRGAHIIPAMLHMCNNARFNMLGYSDTRTETWSHPLPKTQQLLEQELSGNGQAFTSLTVAVTMLLAMGFIPASFLVSLVHEKATNAKHQQLLTGVSPVMYWVSAYCWDLLNCLLAVAVIFLIFVVFQLDAYSGPNAPALLALLLAYCVAMTPQMYCLEPLFSVPSTAYVTAIVLNIFTGTVSVMTTTVLGFYQREIPKLGMINERLKVIFPCILPNYNLGRGMMEIATNHYTRFAAEEFNICHQADPELCSKDGLDWDVAGRFIFTLLVTSAIWFGIRLLIEWRCFTHLCCSRQTHAPAPKSGKEDAAVLEEAARVHSSMQGGNLSASLLISNLSKTFTRARWRGCRRYKEAMHSVKGISVSVSGGECFGLLGVNGAGKTTTMRMITGDIEVGGGDVTLSGWSVRTHRDRARRHLGYCPQFDALTDKLTAREALSFYARIRGVLPERVEIVVEAMISRMCLEAHQNRLCQHLSGGNKRKLSTALALIGEPDVVLLDEPSTGVDVGARRFLWEILGQIRQKGQALVLTSHSMDECEVLCTRLTIMVSGEMRCLGTPLQLKARYGGGYSLAVKAQQPTVAQDGEANKPSLDPALSIRSFMKEKVPMAVLSEENVGLFRYRLGGDISENKVEQEEAPLAEVFGELEAAMAKGGPLEACVLDYTISQTSLEEVFLHFSR